MAKRPEPGRVKTRLAATVGDKAAAALSHAMLLDAVDFCRQWTRDVFVFGAPAKSGPWFRNVLPSDVTVALQEGAGLGERMLNAFASAHQQAPGPMLMIGSDIPAFPGEWLRQAATALESGEADVVFGPSADGGYYLVGMNRPVPEAFGGIRYSQDDTLAQTLEALDRQGIAASLLPEWQDVDVIEDVAWLARQLPSLPPSQMQRTRALLQASPWPTEVERCSF